jgi:putative heme-binding domain-containing protein
LLPALGKLRPKSDPSSIAPELSERLADKQQRLVDRALERLTADQASPQQRIRAIELLSSVGSKRVAETLLTTLRQGGSAEVQLAALAALRSHRSAEVTDTLLELWSGWSPRLRSAAGQFLFASADRSLRVMQAIDEGEIAAEDISISRWNALASSRHATLKQRAKQYLEQSQSSSRGAVIEDYREALSLTGDARRGREVFKKQCAGCHRNGEVGHAIGPNLAAAATRGAESILTNVLDPNREVNPQYLNYVVLTAEGQTVAGMIAAENANSITLGQAESVQQTILRQDIELIRNTNQSIMPEGLEKAISKQAMADLIAYLLKSLR